MVHVLCATEPVAGPSRHALVDTTNYTRSVKSDVQIVQPETLPSSVEPQAGPFHNKLSQDSHGAKARQKATKEPEKDSEIGNSTS